MKNTLPKLPRAFLLAAALIFFPELDPARASLTVNGNVYYVTGDEVIPQPLFIQTPSTITGVGPSSADYTISTTEIYLNADLTFGLGSVGSTPALTIDGNSIVINGSRTITANTGVGLDSSISGANSSSNLTYGGGGVIDLYKANTYNGGTRINGGTTVVAHDQGSFGAGAIAVNGTLGFDINSITAMPNMISGTGRLVITGGNQFILGNANTYSGGTTIQNSSRVTIGTAQALGTGSINLQSGGGLDLNGLNLTVTSQITADASSIITSLPNPGTLTINNSNDNVLAGNLLHSNPLYLVKSGYGSLTISGENSHDGTTLNSGTLNINSNTALGNGRFTINSGTIDNTSGSIVTIASGIPIAWNGDFTFKGTNDLSFGNSPITLGSTRYVTIAANRLTIGGAISGAYSYAGLYKYGNGTLVLTGENTYGGATGIYAGTLQVGDGGTSGSLASSSIYNSGSLIFNRSDDSAYAGSISGSGSLRKVGAGWLSLSGNNSYTGGTTIESGGIYLGSSTALGSATGALTINSGATLDLTSYGTTVGSINGSGSITSTSSDTRTFILNNPADTTLAAALSGSLTFAKSGYGAVTINRGNSYTGGTTLNSGTLNLGHSMAIGNGILTVAGASTIDNITGSPLVMSGIQGTKLNADLTFKGSNDLNLGPGFVSLTSTRSITVMANKLTVGAVFGESSYAGLTKAGNGTLILSDLNFYTGPTTISAGTLQIGNGYSGSLASTYVYNSGSLVFNTSNDISVASAISGSGSLRKVGLNTLTLSGNSSFTGGTVIEGGNIHLGSNTALGTGPVVINAGSRLDLRGYNATVSSLTGLGILNSYGSSASIFTVNNSADSVFAGTFDGNLTFVKSGYGALTLAGENGPSNGVTLNSGTLNLTRLHSLGSGTFTIAGPSTIDNTSGSALTIANNQQAWNADFTFKGTSDLNLGTGNVVMSSTRYLTVTANKLTVGGAISGAYSYAGLYKYGNGTLVLTGENTYGGATGIYAGTLQVGDGGTSGSLASSSIYNSGSLVFNRSDASTFAGAISGSGALRKMGEGILTLSGANSYTGGTFVDAGILRLGNSSALGSAYGGSLFINTGAEIDLAGYNATVTSLTGAGLVGAHGGNTSTFTINNSADVTYNGRIYDNLRLVKSGYGALTLTNDNAITHGTTLNSGTLNLGHQRALGAGSLTIAGSSTIDNTTGSALTLPDNPLNLNADFTFKGSNALDFGTGPVKLTGTRAITVAANTLTLGGPISGTNSYDGLTKYGPGTLVLAGNNTYAGTTTVSAGTLQIGNGGTTGSLASTSLYNSGTVVFNRSDASTLSAAISGSGALQFLGTGPVTLSGTSSYTGATTIGDNSTVKLASAKALGSTSKLEVNGSLDLGGYSNSVAQVVTDSDSAITNNGAAATLTITGSNPSTISGRLANGTGSLTLALSGYGSTTLSGANTHTGGTTLTSGTLNLANTSALGTGALTIAGYSTILDNTSGSALTLANNIAQNWNADFTFKGTNNLNMGSGSILLNASRTVTVAAGTLTLGGNITSSSASAGLTKAGAGTLIFTGNSYLTAPLTISGGTLQIGNNGTSGTFASTSIVNNGTLAFNRSDSGYFDGVISGSGVFRKMGDGAIELRGANTYSGGTVVDSGLLALGHASALGSTSGNLTVNTDGSLDLRGYSVSVGALSGGGLIGSDAPVQNTLTTSSSLNSTFSGSIVAERTKLVKSGSGALTLSGINYHTGGTTLNAGTLNINNPYTLGTGTFTIAGSSTIDNTSGSALLVEDHNKQDWNADFTFKGTNDLNLGAGDVTINASRTVTVSSGTLTVAGLINTTYYSAPGSGSSGGGSGGSSGGSLTIVSGSGSYGGSGSVGGVVHDGAGTVTLTGASTFTGGSTMILVNPGTYKFSSGTVLVYNPTLVAGTANYVDGVLTGYTLANGATLQVPGTPTPTPTPAPTPAPEPEDSEGTFMAMDAPAPEIPAASTPAWTANPAYALTKAGSGTLVLTGHSALTAALTISGGTFQVGDNGTRGSFASTSVINNGTLAFNRSDTNIYSGTISGSGIFRQMGDGSTVLIGANSYSGGTIVDRGILAVGHSSALGSTSGSLAVNTGGTLDLMGYNVTVGSLSGGGTIISSDPAWNSLTISGSANTTFSGSITAERLTLVKSGYGALTLGGANSHGGGTVLSGGTLNINHASALGTGTFTIAGYSTVIDNTSGSALELTTDNAQAWNADFTFKGTNDLDLGDGNVVMSTSRYVTVNAGKLTVGGVISGATAATGVTKYGNGTLVLAANNTYGGATTVYAGTLQIGDGGTSGSVTGSSIMNNGTVAFNRSDAGIYAGIISGSGGLSQIGSGPLTLSGANSYYGATTVGSGSTLVLGNAKALGSTSKLDVSGTLDLHGFSNSAAQVVTSAPSVITNNSSTAATLTLTGYGTNTIAGRLTDGPASLALVQTGYGVTTLSGANTHSGGTTLTYGTLNINNASALGTGRFTLGSYTTIDNTSGSALTLSTNNAQSWNGDFTFKGTNDLNLGTGPVTMSASRYVTVTAGRLTVGGIISGATATTGLTKYGAGTLILTGDNTYSGPTTVYAGTLQLGDGGTTGTIQGSSISNNGTLAFNRSTAFTLSSTITGSGNLQFLGTGPVTLAGTNSYYGATTIGDNSSLTLGSAKALGSTSKLEVNGSLDLNGFSNSVGQIVTDADSLITNTLSLAATLTITGSANSTIAGRIGSAMLPEPPVPSFAAFDVSDPGVDTGSGSSAGAGGGTPPSPLDAVNLALVQTGYGTTTLSGVNNYSGGTTLNAGTLNINNASAIGTGRLTLGSYTTIDNTSGSAITLSTNNAQSWNGDFTFKGTNNLNLGTGDVKLSGTRYLTTTAGTLTVGGVISGTNASDGLYKYGTGTLVLTGNNTYTGTTTVSAGTLQVGNGGTTGSLASTSIYNSGSIVFNRSNAHTVSSAISGSGSLRFLGSGPVTLSGNNSYTGATFVETDTLLTLGSAKALGSTSKLDLNGSVDLNGYSASIGQLIGSADSMITNTSATNTTLTLNGYYSDNVFAGHMSDGSGTLSLVLSSYGATTLSGDSNHSGGTTLNSGTLNINDSTVLGTGRFTIKYATIDNTSGHAVVNGRDNAQTWSGDFTFKGSNDLDLGNGSVQMTSTRYVTVNARTLTVGGGVSGTNSYDGLYKYGAGTLVLGGNNTFTGTTYIYSGRLDVGSGGFTGSLASATVYNYGTLGFNRSDSYTYSGAISGSGSVQKNGVGTTTLSGANSYYGGTTVNAGTLLVSSAQSLGTGKVTLNAGTLGSAGNTTNITIASDLIWNDDARIALALNQSTLFAERVTVGGRVSLVGNGPLVFDFDVLGADGTNASFLVMTATGGFGSLTANSFDFFSYDPTLSGTFRLSGNNLYFDASFSDPVLSLSSFAFSGEESFMAFSFTPVPEPGTISLLILATLGGLFFLRRKARAS